MSNFTNFFQEITLFKGGVKMGSRIGTGYLGSPSLQVSTANQEIIPLGYNFYKFSFDNEQDCTVKVNGGNPIFIRGTQGFEIEHIDSPIRSFIIVESGIQYNWIGAY